MTYNTPLPYRKTGRGSGFQAQKIKRGVSMSKRGEE